MRHVGAVTVILSTTGGALGPKPTHILVTDLPEWRPRQVVRAAQRRGPVAQRNRELTTDLGLGEQPVRTAAGRIAQSLGSAVLAYLLRSRAYPQKSRPGKAWSVAQVPRALR